jgi:hypothetical protein
MLSLLILVFATHGCVEKDTLTPQERDRISQEVEGRVVDYLDAIKKSLILIECLIFGQMLRGLFSLAMDL